MMKFRWQVAGGRRFPFSDEAISEIFRFTDGVPRSIVKLVNESLVKAAVEQRKIIDRETIIAASAEVIIEVK